MLVHVEEDSFWFKHRNRVIKYLVEKFSPEETFFDIGGGNGCTALYLKKHGIDSVLIEPGLSGAYNASRRGLDSVCAVIEELDFVPDSVRAVGLFDVIEHIEDDLDFMQKIRSIVSDSACIYITVPCYQLLWSEEDVIAGHFRRHNLSSITKLLKDSGFAITYSSYFFQCLIMPIFFLRSLPYRLGFRQKHDQDKLDRDHKPAGLITKLINYLLDREFQKLSSGRSLDYGASLILVAQPDRGILSA
jgi:SAM-dependent methyltransferase